MAGGKETPRQKMIGLMYLVLLALLALQVSSAIIQKFQYINSSLELSVEKTDERNTVMLTGIQTAVENAKNNPEDVKILRQAELVRQETQKILAYLNKTKEELIKESGGKDENGSFKGAKDSEIVAQLMLGVGDTKNGKGYDMKDVLNTYSSFMNEQMKKMGINKSFPNLALSGKEDPIFKNDADQKGKDFAHLSFESTPVVAALAVISEKANSILNMETDILDKMSRKVGGNIIPVDKIRPVVMPNSKVVVAGTEYTADMFMAAYSSNYKPQMSFNEENLEVSSTGTGTINFKATCAPGQQTSIKTWKGTVTYPKADGTDSTYVVEEEYTVVRPAILAYSAAIQTLYYKCGNEMNVQVPALGNDYNPSFKASGATLIRGSQTGNVTIVPNSARVQVQVDNNGINLGTLKYKVIPIPKPDIEVNVDLEEGETMRKIEKICVKAVPDENFKESNPRDARYKVTKYTAIINRSGREVDRRVVTNETCNGLNGFGRDARPGDIVVIDIQEVKRLNFQGHAEVVTGIKNRIIRIPVKGVN